MKRIKVERSAVDGRFVRKGTAKRKPRTTIVQAVPKPKRRRSIS